MVLESRCQKLLDQLLLREEPWSVAEIAMEYQISKRSVYYDVQKLEYFFEVHQLPNLEIKQNRGFYLSKEHKEIVATFLKRNRNVRVPSYYFSPAERLKIIICFIIVGEKEYLIEDFMNVCHVSRNTIINDLKQVKQQLATYDLALVYQVRQGYRITGDVIRKRALYFLYFPELAAFYKKGLLKMGNEHALDDNLQALEYIEKTLATKYVGETLWVLASFIPVLSRSEAELTFSNVEQQTIQMTYEFKLVAKKFPHLQFSEKLYLTLHLLGSRLQEAPFEIMNRAENEEAYRLAQRLVAEFSQIACVEFENQSQIEHNLMVHLKSSLIRYRYGIQLGNPLGADIKRQYADIFEITKKAALVLTHALDIPISDNEIAYLTLHFGASLAPSQSAEPLRILIVCPSGLATGNMLKVEVSALIPYAKTIEVGSLSEYEMLRDRYSLIISTIPVFDHPNRLVVHPILTDTDRLAILQKGMGQISGQLGTSDVFAVIKDYLHHDDYETVKVALDHLFEKGERQALPVLKTQSDGLLTMLDEQSVTYWSEDMDWQQALYKAATPLLEKEVIVSSYVEAMVQEIRKMGPYMFINHDVVLAHAKSELGVNRLGLSLALFKTPVLFPQERSATIILVLAAEDRVKHLSILKDIMTVFATNHYKELHQGDAFEHTFATLRRCLNS